MESALGLIGEATARLPSGAWLAALTPDRRRAVSGSDDKTLKVWDLDTGACLLTFHGDEPIECCAIAADAQTLVARDALGSVHILRVENLPLEPGL